MLRARAFACRRGYASDSDDFAQEAAIYALKHGQIRLSWVFTDYLRENYGRTGTPKGDAMAIARARTIKLDAKISDSGESDELLHSVVADARSNPDRGLELRDLLTTLRPRDERDWFLVECALAGYTQRQIGVELGLSESRVSQLMKAMISGSNEFSLIMQLTRPEQRGWVSACYRKRRI